LLDKRTDDASYQLIQQCREVSDFKKLNVWRKAHALALNTHRIAARIRGTQNGSLRSQMVRAAMSVPTNIVEGRGQKSEAEFSRFLRIALNSSSELEYHLIVAHDTGVISKSDFLTLLNDVTEVRKMLHGLIAKLSHVPVRSTRNRTVPS
jgi:four helix bundle protein